MVSHHVIPLCTSLVVEYCHLIGMQSQYNFPGGVNEIYSMDSSVSWMSFTNHCTGGATCNILHTVNNEDIDLLSFKIDDAVSCIGNVPTPLTK